jgi:3-oxoacyl-[acyl-carrier protein] reductase
MASFPVRGQAWAKRKTKEKGESLMSRSVLVTGGSRGIGLAIARAFAAAGDRVAVTRHTSPPPEDLFAVECDVRDSASVEAAFAAVEAEHGPVQVLVCNAGITRDKLLLSMAEADFTDVVTTNLTAAFLLAKRATRKMITARYGRLVFISSVVALRGEAGQANYAAAKAGLIGLARSLARELGPRGITANVVLPGLTRTDMSAQLDDARIATMVSQIPLGRLAEPGDIAAAVTFLASDAAGYISGAVLAVDGAAATGH